MKAEESRYIIDEQGVKRLIRGGRPIPAQWEDAYEGGEPVPEKAQTAPQTDKAQKEPETTKSGATKQNPITQAATRRRK